MSLITSLIRRSDEPLAEVTADGGRYLTDGTRLYRVADELPATAGHVWLEDCRTLECVIAAAADVDSLRVVATAQRSASA